MNHQVQVVRLVFADDTSFSAALSLPLKQKLMLARYERQGEKGCIELCCHCFLLHEEVVAEVTNENRIARVEYVYIEASHPAMKDRR